MIHFLCLQSSSRATRGIRPHFLVSAAKAEEKLITGRSIRHWRWGRGNILTWRAQGRWARSRGRSWSRSRRRTRADKCRPFRSRGRSGAGCGREVRCGRNGRSRSGRGALRESTKRWNNPACNNQKQHAAHRSHGKNIQRLGPGKAHNSKGCHLKPGGWPL